MRDGTDQKRELNAFTGLLLHSAHEFIEYCHKMNETKIKKRKKYEQKPSHTAYGNRNTKQIEYMNEWIRSLTRWIWQIYNLNDDFNLTCHLIRLYPLSTYAVFAVLCTVLDSQSTIHNMCFSSSSAVVNSVWIIRYCW